MKQATLQRLFLLLLMIFDAVRVFAGGSDGGGGCSDGCKNGEECLSSPVS